MKFWDRFKKKDNTQAVNTGEHQTVANDHRRFTLVVDDTFQLLNDRGIVVTGKVHGKIKAGDAVYIFRPGSAVILTQVNTIEIGFGPPALEAEEQNVAIHLTDIKDKKEIAKFSVLTSIRPQSVVDVNTAVENPYLLGLSMDYNGYYQDNTYFNLLVYEICHAHFIVPMYLDKEPEKQAGGTAVFREDTHIQFISIKHPEYEAEEVFPVFTDWSALGKWKNVFDETHPPKTMIFPFPDAVTVSNNFHGGIVINPYGPVPVYLPTALVKQITAMEGYRKEFGEGKGGTDKVREVKVEKDTQVMVGLPAESAEVQMIRENMILVAKQERDIRRIDLYLKVDEMKERTYLCVVDCPEEEAKRIFGAIYQAVGSYFSEVKLMDFITYNRAGFVKDILEKYPPVYMAGEENF